MVHPFRRVGFPCVLSDGSLSTSHTFRLAALSPERLQRAVDQNLDDLEKILRWMRGTPLRMFRLGSSFIPFASHPNMDFDWTGTCRERLAEIGREFSDFRFSMHPGQYNVLNSPTPSVVEATIRELDYAARVLSMLGGDESHKIILHGGGLYGDREASTRRLVEAVRALPPHIHSRLALENDERYFNLAEILGVAQESGVAVVFDIHHHLINPCKDVEALLREVPATWAGAVPKVHISSQRPGARAGAHDDMIFREDLERFAAMLPFEADLMIEAKAKEVAALRVCEWLASA